jgi:Zn-dependent metalloprotease
MKLNRYYFSLFVLLLTIYSFAAQTGKKLKTPLPANQTANSTIVNSTTYSNITTKLLNFINKVGISPKSAKLYPANSNAVASIITNNSRSAYVPLSLNSNNKSLSKIVLDRDFGTPRLIDVKPSGQNVSNVQSNRVPEVEAMNFLINNKSLLKISDPSSEFSILNSKKDDYGITHIRYAQIYRGLEVWGKDIYIHLNNQANVLSLTGRYAPTPIQIRDIKGRINATAAINGAVNELSRYGTIISLSDQIGKLLNYAGPVAKKVIWYDKTQQPHLAWHIEVRSGLSRDWYYFIDANSGTILNSYNNVCYDGATTGSGKDLNGVTRTFGTYSVSGTYYMLDAAEQMFNSAQSQIPNSPVGGIMCLDLKNTDLSSSSQYYFVSSTNDQWTDPSSVSANYNAITTYQYYKTIHNRNSIDDKGMTIFSIIHATENSQSMANAFWSGQVMCYGDGGSIFKPLAGGLDVGAHEMTHGVTQNTSNLEYQDQSGALNESMSDVFGKLVDTTTWQIGPTIIQDLQTFPSGALRDMRDPHNGGSSDQDPCWQPATLNEYVTTTSDNGGVHVNSGIPNHAFYYVASYIGRSSAGKIWYLAETSYLTHTSQFVDERIATEKAAKELFGDPSNELTAVQKAWDNVGVFESAPTPTPPPSQLTGQNWILAVNTGLSDPNSLYMSKPIVNSSADYSALSQTPFHNRPAVTDTSGFILFIDASYNLRAIYANPQSPQEEVLDNHGIWGSVAIGPGLSSFAITTHYIDTTIYYFDLNDTSNNKAVKIRTPAYDAENAATSLYADEMSFDPTGRFLLFDSYNLMRGVSGEIAFWTINLLDVHSGSIETVFPAQPEGIDVGNPSFSKTTQTRFTFDFHNTLTNRFAVMAADFNTGTVAIVDSTTTFDIGYPTYSGDDRTIAYHTKTVQNGFLQDAIQQMPLQSDFITGSGAPKQYLVDATYPVWFVIGNRITTDVKPEPTSLPKITLLEQNYPNPFNPTTMISWQLAKSTNVSLKVYDILGNEITTLVDGFQNAGLHSITFNPAASGGKHLTSGIYFYQLKAGSYMQTRKMILLK